MEVQREKESVESVVKIEEWLFLILIAMLPIINFLVFGYFCFNRRLNANKRNCRFNLFNHYYGACKFNWDVSLKGGFL